MMDDVTVENRIFKGLTLPTENSRLLVIQGTKGFLGCGYIKVATADKIDEAVAIVTGVKNYDDMLAAEVIAVSAKAQSLGISTGMSGREALLLLSD